MKKRFASERTL